MGWNSLHTNRTLLGHAKDGENLAQHLNLDEYHVMVDIPSILTTIY